MLGTVKVKKIAAIHDLSGVGRVSLMVVIPILSTMGFEVCPLPTAVLSNHTQYPTFSFLDLTDEMERIIAAWKTLHAQFDTIYSGYLGSPRQVHIVKDFIDDFRQDDTLVVVDPVLGDNGKLYTKMNDEMVREMRSLAAKADVVTPNLTELFYLLGKPYQAECTDDQLKQYLSVYAYSRFNDQYWKVTCSYLPAHYPGTGDAYTSVVTGSLMQGDSLPIALDRASQFTLQAIRATFGYQYDSRDGILLERVLPNLNMPMQSCSYELI